jgi:photosystem II stability/assembly factor-like uncharacterized protein
VSIVLALLVLTGALALFPDHRAQQLTAQGALWQQVMDGLYGDTVGDIVLMGAPPVTVRSMLLLSRGSSLHRANSDTGGWDAVYADPDRTQAEVLVAAPAPHDGEGGTVYAGLRGAKRFARSEDSGRNWTALTGPSEVDRLDRLASSQGSGRIYAARSNRYSMWTSNDRGVSWDPHKPPGPPVAELPMDDLFSAPDDPYVYLVRGGQLNKTNDDPGYWVLALGPNPEPPFTATLEVALAAVGPRGRLHAVGLRGEAYYVMSSEDRGVTWNAEGWPENAGDAEPTALGAGESRPGVNAVWLGLEDGRVYGSESGGRTWSLVAELPLSPTRIVSDPDTHEVWVGTEGLGLYRVVGEWLHTGAVPVNVLAAVAPTYAEDGLALLNVEVLPERREDLGSLLPALHGIYESTGGDSWARRLLTTGLGADLIASPDFANDGRLFSGDKVSHDAGATWQALTVGPSGEPPFISAVGPLTGTQPVLYALEEPYDDEEVAGGLGRLLSEDGGGTWFATDGSPSGIVAVAVSPAFVDDRTAFAVTGNGFVYRATDGTTFAFVGRIPATDPFGRSVYDLAISPAFADDESLTAAVENVASSQRARVYVSNDAGVAWQQRTVGLMSASRPRVLTLSAGFAEDRIVFLGGERAATDPPLAMIYGSDSAGAEWYVEAFLPPGSVGGFAWGGGVPDGRLFAAAGDAGLWVRDLARPIGDTSNTATPTEAVPSPQATETPSPSATVSGTLTTPGTPATPDATAAASDTPTATGEVSSTSTPTTPPPTSTPTASVAASESPTSPASSTPEPTTPTPDGGSRLYVPAAFKGQ